jgi:hypothetical protein
MVCEEEMARYRASLEKLRDMFGPDRAIYPGATIRDLARSGALTKEDLDAFLEREVSKNELRRCVREAFERGEV